MILSIKDLTVEINRSIVLDRINIDLQKEKITTLIGESGSGKSVFSKSILGLLPGGFEISRGRIIFNQKPVNISALSKLRGKNIFYIPQNAQASLNPVKKIAGQISALNRVFFKETLLNLNFSEPSRVLNSYPFELSGGENQRVIIAMALQQEPDLLILDEPTTGLDSSVLDKFVQLLKEVQKSYSLTMLLITHKLRLVFALSDYTYVIYRGKIVDSGPKTSFLNTSEHPYTRLLMANQKLLLI
jgi:ABC-type dipeptide/oligopeptide/nickel transport system ATPase component